MPIEVLFIQGGGEKVHDDWDAKLVDSLARALGDGYHVRYPRMPGEDDPHYATWRTALLQELAALGDGAILVGHSIGATMLVHALAEQWPSFTPGALVLLAAPYIGEGGWPSDELAARTDFGVPAAVPVLLYQGTDDDTVTTAHAQLYARDIPHARVHVLAKHDHQLNNDLAAVARDLRAL